MDDLWQIPDWMFRALAYALLTVGAVGFAWFVYAQCREARSYPGESNE